MITRLLMLALCLFVLLSMAGILKWFFARLRKIELQRWGNIPDQESILSSMARYKAHRKSRKDTGE